MASLDLRSAVENISVRGREHENFYDYIATTIEHTLACPHHARTQSQLQVLEAYTRSFFAFNRLPLASRIQLCRGIGQRILKEGESVSKQAIAGLWLVFSGAVQVSGGAELNQLVAGDAFRPDDENDMTWTCRALEKSVLLHLTPLQLQSVANYEQLANWKDKEGPAEDLLAHFMGMSPYFAYATQREQQILARAAQKVEVGAGEKFESSDHLIVVLNGEVAVGIPGNCVGVVTEENSSICARAPASSAKQLRSFNHYAKRGGRSLKHKPNPSYSSGFAVSSRYTLMECPHKETNSQDLIKVAQLGPGAVIDTNLTELVFHAVDTCSVAFVNKTAVGLEHETKSKVDASLEADVKRAFMRCTYSKFIPLHATDKMAESCTIVKLTSHEVFAEQGQPCNHIYMVLKGVVSIHVRKSDAALASECFTLAERFGPCVRRITSGGSVGEQEALRSSNHANTCIAAGPVTLLAMVASTFRNIFAASFVETKLAVVPKLPSEVGRAEYSAALLRTVYPQNQRLMDLQEDTLVHLCQEAQWLDYSANEIIWSDSQSMEGFLLVLEGSVSLFRHETAHNKKEGLPKPLHRLRECVDSIIQRQRLIKSFKPVRRRSITAPQRVDIELGVCVGLAFQGCAFGQVDRDFGGRPFEDDMTIIAREESLVLLMSPVLVHKLRSAMETRITAELEQVLMTPESSRTAVERQSLACFLLETKLMVEVKNRCFGASVDDLNRLCDQVRLVRIGPGETVFRQGQPCTAVFMILSGEVDLNGQALHPGDCIGHDSLESKEVLLREHTATAQISALLISLSKRALENAKLHKTVDQEISGLIRQNPVLQQRPRVASLLTESCRALTVERFDRVEDVIKRGEEVKDILFLLEGCLTLTCDAGEREINATVATLPFLGIGEASVCLNTTFKYGVKSMPGTTLIKLPVEAYLNLWPPALQSNGVVQLLQQNALFANATKSELLNLAILAKMTRLPKNAHIFYSARKPTQLALIKSGECYVSHFTGGTEKTSRIIAKGDSFGEEYWETASPLKESLIAATTDVEVLLISFKHLHATLLPTLRRSFKQVSRAKREWADELVQRQTRHMRVVEIRQPISAPKKATKKEVKEDQSWLAKAVRIAPARERNRGNHFLGSTSRGSFTPVSLSTSQTQMTSRLTPGHSS